MKNFSIGLNVLLLVAVGYLYYANILGNKGSKGVGKNSGFALTRDSICHREPIAYVELDSLNANITYIKDRRKELETEQRAIEAVWENGYKGLEAQKNEFMKKGASITQEEAQHFQDRLMMQKDKIDGLKQQSGQALSEKSFKFMDDIQKKLKDFLAEYNKDKKYMYILTYGSGLDYMLYKDSSLNITKDVIKGMNEKMRAETKP